jgi:hypothetical protein
MGVLEILTYKNITASKRIISKASYNLLKSPDMANLLKCEILTDPDI